MVVAINVKSNIEEVSVRDSTRHALSSLAFAVAVAVLMSALLSLL